jgi:hypothetical protein
VVFLSVREAFSSDGLLRPLSHHLEILPMKEQPGDVDYAAFFTDALVR